ncbi:hypothetical protein BB559_001362 [Furculomyces boomerangus]|uniref:Uncharacterized protein n=1 Tax=Furculomyces boomerangus TaxID=61424 RepID=A0A2T9Z246_9FUNG|nr:hypothetical protein BB559_001362 [Furculomyces boomerangus]
MSRNSLHNELEEVEQKITLMLQEIDANFDKCQRIVTRGILPKVGRIHETSKEMVGTIQPWLKFFVAVSSSENEIDQVGHEHYEVLEQLIRSESIKSKENNHNLYLEDDDFIDENHHHESDIELDQFEMSDIDTLEEYKNKENDMEMQTDENFEYNYENVQDKKIFNKSRYSETNQKDSNNNNLNETRTLSGNEIRENQQHFVMNSRNEFQSRYSNDSGSDLFHIESHFNHGGDTSMIMTPSSIATDELLTTIHNTLRISSLSIPSSSKNQHIQAKKKLFMENQNNSNTKREISNSFQDENTLNKTKIVENKNSNTEKSLEIDHSDIRFSSSIESSANKSNNSIQIQEYENLDKNNLGTTANKEIEYEDIKSQRKSLENSKTAFIAEFEASNDNLSNHDDSDNERELAEITVLLNKYRDEDKRTITIGEQTINMNLEDSQDTFANYQSLRTNNHLNPDRNKISNSIPNHPSNPSAPKMMDSSMIEHKESKNNIKTLPETENVETDTNENYTLHKRYPSGVVGIDNNISIGSNNSMTFSEQSRNQKIDTERSITTNRSAASKCSSIGSPISAFDNVTRNLYTFSSGIPMKEVEPKPKKETDFSNVTEAENIANMVEIPTSENDRPVEQLVKEGVNDINSDSDSDFLPSPPQLTSMVNYKISYSPVSENKLAPSSTNDVSSFMKKSKTSEQKLEKEIESGKTKDTSSIKNLDVWKQVNDDRNQPVVGSSSVGSFVPSLGTNKDRVNSALVDQQSRVMGMRRGNESRYEDSGDIVMDMDVYDGDEGYSRDSLYRSRLSDKFVGAYDETVHMDPNLFEMYMNDTDPVQESPLANRRKVAGTGGSESKSSEIKFGKLSETFLNVSNHKPEFSKSTQNSYSKSKNSLNLGIQRNSGLKERPRSFAESSETNKSSGDREFSLGSNRVASLSRVRSCDELSPLQPMRQVRSRVGVSPKNLSSSRQRIVSNSSNRVENIRADEGISEQHLNSSSFGDYNSSFDYGNMSSLSFSTASNADYCSIDGTTSVYPDTVLLRMAAMHSGRNEEESKE